MNYKQAIDYLNRFIDFERHPEPRLKTENKDIDRFRTLLDGLGKPHLAYPTIHIAGTKGKGSTSALIASILQASGYKTGLYTSPHLVSVRERIEISGREISKRQFGSLMGELKLAFESTDFSKELAFRTVFELITAAGFLAFQKAKVDIGIIEAGLGAKLDATIVVEPVISVMTPVGLDHTNVLGSTITEIATDKSHIYKSGSIAVSSPQVKEAYNVIARHTQSLGQSVTFAPGEEEFEILEISGEKSIVKSNRYWLEGALLELPLAGRYQLTNLSTALTALEKLKELGWKIPPSAVELGVSRVRWPGRMDIVQRNPTVILDGAHNTLAMEAVDKSFRELYPNKKPHLIFSSIIGKPLEDMVEVASRFVDKAHFVRLRFPKGVTLEALESAGKKAGIDSRCYDSSFEALSEVIANADKDDIILVTGSLYLVSEAFRYFRKLPLPDIHGGIDSTV